ncbi:MAG: hypothetical protein DMD31_06765 [Gemmatimonadetes bacterium]|nr:MAG: hypothetical protein DMD31_06765 [Gemmatimonadota bacterium]
MKRLTFAALATAVIAIGCRDQRLLQPPAHGALAALIVDGAHSGNPDFFFLPPLVPDPTNDPNFDPGKFNPNLSPTVEVCVLTGNPGLGSVDCATDGSGNPVLVFGPATMPLDGEQYHLNWDTKSPVLLDATTFYRITVRGAPRGTALGVLDVDPVLGGMKNAKTGEVFLFQDGRTLPIKVRIEDGAFGATNADHVEQVVPSRITTPFLDVTTNTGFAGARFFDGWLPLGIDQVVVIIDRIPVNDATSSTSCLRSANSELEGCYRFRTDPDLHGLGVDGVDLPFRVNVIAGVCFEIPGDVGSPDAPPYGLNRREEVEGTPTGPIVTLEDVPTPFLTCGTFARTPPPSVLGVVKSGQLRDLPSAAWHALVWGVTRLVAPRVLHAVDLGAGGSTDGFSRFGWLRSATMTKVITTDNQIGPTNTALPVDPQVCLTYTHHTGPQPLANEPVTFTVMTGGGTVGGGSSATVNTGTDGCAHASWVLGGSTSLGGNTLRVTALADGSPLTFTATGVVSPTGIPLSSLETIFTFDLTSHLPAPPYNAITFAVTFSVEDPVSGTDVLITNVYGAANGTQLLQNRNDTGLITAGGTVYGPLQTANPIFDPMLDGTFSFGLVMTSGTAVVKEFKVCGVIFVPFQQTCTSIPQAVP